MLWQCFKFRTDWPELLSQAASFLSSLFPNWNPMPGDSELCASCEADLYNMKEDKRGLRKQIEEEKVILIHQAFRIFWLGYTSSIDDKARLKFLQEPTLDLWTEQLTACAVLPLHFVRQWKRWIDGHVGNGRPDAPDNSPLFCEHSKLTFDPNCPSDTDSLITVISRSDWDVLQKTWSSSLLIHKAVAYLQSFCHSRYPCGALIALTKARNENGQILYTPDVPTCTDCRLKWYVFLRRNCILQPAHRAITGNRTGLRPKLWFGCTTATIRKKQVHWHQKQSLAQYLQVLGTMAPAIRDDYVKSERILNTGGFSSKSLQL